MNDTNSIKQATLVKNNNTSQFDIAQVDYLGKTSDCLIVTPYGICSKSPPESSMLMLNIQGQEENKQGFADLQQESFKELKDYELQIGNYKTRVSIKFDDIGDMVIDCLTGNININAGNVIVNADKVAINSDEMTINANIKHTGTLTSNGKNISDSHSHSGVQPGPGNTGTVV